MRDVICAVANVYGLPMRPCVWAAPPPAGRFDARPGTSVSINHRRCGVWSTIDGFRSTVPWASGSRRSNVESISSKESGPSFCAWAEHPQAGKVHGFHQQTGSWRYRQHRQRRRRHSSCRDFETRTNWAFCRIPESRFLNCRPIDMIKSASSKPRFVCDGVLAFCGPPDGHG